MLDLDGAAHRIDDALKFDEKPVAGGLDDAPAVLGDFGVAQLAADRRQCGKRPFLIGPISREWPATSAASMAVSRRPTRSLAKPAAPL